MHDRTSKALGTVETSNHSYQAKAPVKATRTKMNGTFLLKCLAAFCMLGNVTASPTPTCGCSEAISALRVEFQAKYDKQQALIDYVANEVQDVRECSACVSPSPPPPSPSPPPPSPAPPRFLNLHYNASSSANSYNGRTSGCIPSFDAGDLDTEVKWTKLAWFNEDLLQIDALDTTYATTVSGSGKMGYSAPTIASGYDCAGSGSTRGMGVIDLRGTPYVIAGVSDTPCYQSNSGGTSSTCFQWITNGYAAAVKVTCSNGNQRCVVQCGGFSGGCSPINNILQLEWAPASPSPSPPLPPPVTSGTCNENSLFLGHLLDKAECDNLAASLSHAGQTAAWATPSSSATAAPRGCYLYTSSGWARVYYNSFATGACTSTRQCLCHFDSPLPPSPPPPPADCDCDFHEGGCSISEAAPEGKACKCVYKGAWTCGGDVVSCGNPASPKCAAPDKSVASCAMGGGDCGGYSGDQDCDCDYHSGGCTISKVAPKHTACECSYKGAFTCDGEVVQCRDDWDPLCLNPDLSETSCNLAAGSDCDGY